MDLRFFTRCSGCCLFTTPLPAFLPNLLIFCLNSKIKCLLIFRHCTLKAFVIKASINSCAFSFSGYLDISFHTFFSFFTAVDLVSFSFLIFAMIFYLCLFFFSVSFPFLYIFLMFSNSKLQNYYLNLSKIKLFLSVLLSLFILLLSTMSFDTLPLPFSTCNFFSSEFLPLASVSSAFSNPHQVLDFYFIFLSYQIYKTAKKCDISVCSEKNVLKNRNMSEFDLLQIFLSSDDDCGI